MMIKRALGPNISTNIARGALNALTAGEWSRARRFANVLLRSEMRRGGLIQTSPKFVPTQSGIRVPPGYTQFAGRRDPSLNVNLSYGFLTPNVDPLMSQWFKPEARIGLLKWLQSQGKGEGRFLRAYGRTQRFFDRAATPQTALPSIMMPGRYMTDPVTGKAFDALPMWLRLSPDKGGFTHFINPDVSGKARLLTPEGRYLLQNLPRDVGHIFLVRDMFGNAVKSAAYRMGQSVGLTKQATPWSRRILALARAGKPISVGGTAVTPAMTEGNIVDLVTRDVNTLRPGRYSPTGSVLHIMPRTAAEKAMNYYADSKRHRLYREALRHGIAFLPEPGPATAAERLAKLTRRQKKLPGVREFYGLKPSWWERIFG